MRATAMPGVAPSVSAPFPRSSSASPSGRQLAADPASPADRSSSALSCTGTDAPSHAAWPCSGSSAAVRAAAANVAGGWARAIAPASLLAR